ncbi:DUF1800 family protein [Prosthecobacter algae]
MRRAPLWMTVKALVLSQLLPLSSPLSAASDYNGDGVCDVWQQLHNAWSLLPGDDEDGDGSSNILESIAGTDPRNPADVLRISESALVENDVRFTLPSSTGKRYQLLSSDSPNGPVWTPQGSALTGTGAAIQFTTPKGDGTNRKFYKVETSDQDTDEDGINDWAEGITGTNPALATSPGNASGGTASDADVLASLFALTTTTLPSTTGAQEKEGLTSRIRLSRPADKSAMPLTLAYASSGNPVPSRGSASSGDFTLTVDQPSGQITGAATGTLTLPAGASQMDVIVHPVLDSTPEVPELLTLNILRPGSGPATPPLTGTALIRDADPTNEDNRTLFVAYLGKEAGVSTTATGIATALVQGDNDEALISLTFSNLTSPQNTAYLRVDSDLEIINVGLGQVTGKQWQIRAAQTKFTDQAMLTALHAGQLYISITTAENPTGEIRGYFNKATGSTSFAYNPALHDGPAYGSPEWQSVAGAAIERDIYRFLEQCTFGPTAELYTEVRAEVDAAMTGGQTYLKGLENWLDKQMDPAITPNPSLTTLTMAADNEEFVLRGNKPLWSGNDPQYGEVSYGVSYDAFGNPTVSTTSNGTYNNNHPFHNNRRREQWTLALQSKAQVRQRMTQALSEILVISEIDATVQGKHYGAAAYWDMLADNAFGKYRDLLQKVTYHPMMGIYLSHLRNRATYISGGVTISPDENYAREIMQLFSIGLVLRHPDGSLVLGQDGLPVPTYDNGDITELARVLTGFCHGARHLNASVQRFNGMYMAASNIRVSPTIEIQGGAGGINGNGTTFTNFSEGGGDSWWQAPWIYPMKVLGKVGTVSAAAPTLHDFGAKTLLAGKHGQTLVPAQTVVTATADGTSHTMAEADITLAHNCLAGNPSSGSYNGHQNTPINISRWLIQRLTSSNPSSGYLYRVSERYRQTNGNLGSVLKAIMLDHEARSIELADTTVGNGRMKEPMVHFMAVIRALKGYTGIPLTTLRDVPIPFSSTDSPMSTPYPQAEVDKFVPNASRFRFADTSSQLGQSPLRAPSVFNWFLPDYSVPGAMSEAGLVAPEMQIATETSIVARVNRLWTFTWMSLTGMTTFPGVDLEDPVQLTGNAGPQVKVSKSLVPTATENSFLALQSYTFTPANWNTAQTVTVAAVDDNIAEGSHTTRIHHAVSSTDADYSNLAIPSLNVTINDNETAGTARVIIAETGSETLVAEGGTTDTYTLALSQAPVSPVTVNLQTTVNNIGTYTTEVTVSPASVTFTSANWSAPQTVTVTAVNDTTSEVLEIAQIGHSLTTADTVYRQVGVASINVLVADNDPTGSNDVNLLQTQNGTLALEGGASDSYYLNLRRAPTATVAMAINTNADLTATPPSLSFTTTNWNIPQKVQITAVDDALIEGTEAFTITNVPSGGGYTATNTKNVAVTIQDNDGGSVIISETSGGTSVVESSATTSGNPQAANTDSYTLRLGSQPDANVTITVTPERHPTPMSNWAKASGYFGNDTSGSALQKDRLIFDYSEIISIYNAAYVAAGGNANASTAHFAGTLAVVDKLDLYLCGGRLKAQTPDLSLADLSNMGITNPRKSVVNGVYRGYSTTRLTTDTTNYNNEVRDRCRIAAYLVSISPQSFSAR